MMRHLFTLLMSFLPVFAYSHDYHSLLSNSGRCCEKCFGTGCVYQEFVRGGTTIINDERYIIISGYYLQEDPLLKKVWYLNHGEKELLYDFSLEVNDSFHIELYDTIIGIYEVVEVDTIETLAGARMPWTLYLKDSLTIEYGTLSRDLVWIEGMGSTYGPVYPKLLPYSDKFGGWDICVEGAHDEDGNQIYQGNCDLILGYWSDQCEYIKSGIENSSKEKTFALFNELGQLKISSAEPILNIYIYDLSGKLLLINENLAFEKSITLTNHLPTGIYICEIHHNNDVRKSIKVIKAF